MVDPFVFQRIVSGKQRGAVAFFSRLLLAGLEIPYSGVVSFRNRAYDKNWKKVNRLPVPVISVGNLTLGGTGKTPFVIYLVKKCLEMGIRPGVASRGYRADVTGWNDETRELALLYPDLPQAISPKRFPASQKMLEIGEAEKSPVQLVILDDGFQYRKMHRDIDIVLLDATEPFGYRRIFPRGFLRESISSLKRADVVVLSRSDFIPYEERQKIREEVLSINPSICWCEMIHTPVSFLTLSGQSLPLSSYYGKKVTAFCGIGNPEAFRKTLEQCHLKIDAFLSYPDHCFYDHEKVSHILEVFHRSHSSDIVCTVKDIVKIAQLKFDDLRCSALVASSQLTVGGRDFDLLMGDRLHY